MKGTAFTKHLDNALNENSKCAPTLTNCDSTYRQALVSDVYRLSQGDENLRLFNKRYFARPKFFSQFQSTLVTRYKMSRGRIGACNIFVHLFALDQELCVNLLTLNITYQRFTEQAEIVKLVLKQKLSVKTNHPAKNKNRVFKQKNILLT